MGEDARAKKLRHLLARLKSGKHVQNRELGKALGESAYADFESAWREQLELRKQLKDKPDEIRDYEAKLKRAIFLENKAAGARAMGAKGTEKLARAAEAAFDGLYEKLGEMIATDSTLAGWFDRNVRWNTSNFPDLSSIDAPRVVTASSGGGIASGIRSKRDTKMAAIEFALDGLNEDADANARLNADMQQRLARVVKLK